MRQILNVLRHIIDSKLNSWNSTLANVLSSYFGGVVHHVSREAICRSGRRVRALIEREGTTVLSFTWHDPDATD